jgi:hypothetical protein
MNRERPAKFFGALLILHSAPADAAYPFDLHPEPALSRVWHARDDSWFQWFEAGRHLSILHVSRGEHRLQRTCSGRPSQWRAYVLRDNWHDCRDGVHRQHSRAMCRRIVIFCARWHREPPSIAKVPTLGLVCSVNPSNIGTPLCRCEPDGLAESAGRRILFPSPCVREQVQAFPC